MNNGKSKLILRLLGLAYVFHAFMALLFPEVLINAINSLPIDNPNFTKLDTFVVPFWQAFVAAYFVTLSTLTFLQADNLKESPLLIVHLIAKFATILTFVHLYFNQSHCIAYIIGMAIELCIIVLITAVFLRVTLKRDPEENSEPEIVEPEIHEPETSEPTLK